MESKKITFRYDGRDITLAFTRRTVEQLERVGFRMEEIGEQPATMTKLLWHGAFMANHRRLDTRVIDEIYEHMPRKDEVIAKLAEMYNETRESLFDEPEEGDEKNVEWKANW